MKRYNNDRILVYGDIHAPYHDKRVLDFLNDLNNEYKFDRIIDIGDTLDNYATSRYPKDPGAKNVVQELKKAKKFIKKLGALFPKVDLMESNHCDRAYRRAMNNGIPREWLLKYKDLIGAPDGWNWHEQKTITINSTRQQVFFAHTKTGTTLNVAKTVGCNAVLGHHHNKMGVQFFNTPNTSYFAADTGCLLSDTGSAFTYNRGNVIRPIKGCLLILEGQPVSIRLE